MPYGWCKRSSDLAKKDTFALTICKENENLIAIKEYLIRHDKYNVIIQNCVWTDGNVYSYHGVSM